MENWKKKIFRYTRGILATFTLLELFFLGKKHSMAWKLETFWPLYHIKSFGPLLVLEENTLIYIFFGHTIYNV